MLGQTSGSGGGGRMAVSEPKLSLLAQSLAKVYRSRDVGECMKIAQDFSVFVQEENSFGSGSGGGRGGAARGWGGRAGGSGSTGKKKRVLNYWCFSPGVVMEELKKLGVRSLLLTSGDTMHRPWHHDLLCTTICTVLTTDIHYCAVIRNVVSDGSVPRRSEDSLHCFSREPTCHQVPPITTV
jgi:hypothetical protein